MPFNENPLEARAVGMEALMQIAQNSENEERKLRAAEILLIHTNHDLAMDDFVDEAIRRREEGD